MNSLKAALPGQSTHAAGQATGHRGGPGAWRDTQIGKALCLIHERPQQHWTVERLARAVAMSRAAFARRFNELVGEPPLAYTTRRRMDLAAQLLRESGEPLSWVASRVGYVSETAFAKAFRRRLGIAPGAYRCISRGGEPNAPWAAGPPNFKHSSSAAALFHAPHAEPGHAAGAGECVTMSDEFCR